MEMSEADRELHPNERQLLDRLLEARFPGRDEVAEQLRSCRVRTVDEHGCLDFTVLNDVRAPVDQRVPAEAKTTDSNGNGIHVQLHVLNGQVDELEFYSESGDPIGDLPPAEQWELKVTR